MTSAATARAEALLLQQRTAFRRDGESGLALRRERLKRLDCLVESRADAFAKAINDDFGGRAFSETRLYEVFPVRTSIRHAIRHLRGWMKAKRVPVALSGQPGRGWVRHQPLGTVGIISPWNYPLFLALSPLTDVLAAGNRALIKPSEYTPHFSDLLAKAIAEFFSDEEVAVVTGGADVARHFSSLAFDHLLFTGSTRIGHEVMKAAAANMVPVTLELGGKSPAIVLPGADLARAARSIAFGKFLNAGQTCIAPDYVLVHETAAAELADLILAETRRSFPAIAGNPDYAALISPSSYDRLARAVDVARQLGATVLSHGDAADPGTRRYPPTLLLSPPREGVLATEEIFGPVLPIIAYNRIDDAIAHVEAGGAPLALYCFGTNEADIEQVLSRTRSGGVTINGTLLHIAQDNLPFGGVGQSGLGAYRGYAGFQRFSHARSIFKAGRIIGVEQFRPPYGKRTKRLIALLERLMF